MNIIAEIAAKYRPEPAAPKQLGPADRQHQERMAAIAKHAEEQERRKRELALEQHMVKRDREESAARIAEFEDSIPRPSLQEIAVFKAHERVMLAEQVLERNPQVTRIMADGSVGEHENVEKLRFAKAALTQAVATYERLRDAHINQPAACGVLLDGGRR